MILFLLALAQPVSYYRDIQPVLTFQCNRCHGDEGAAGGLDTRTYASFHGVNSTLLLDLLEGKRGESRRMPREAPPLGAAMVAKFRQWIAEGAREDRDDTPRRTWTAAFPGAATSVACETKDRAYVSVQVVDAAGREFYGTAEAFTGRRVWTIRRAAHWPAALRIQVTVSYSPESAIVNISKK
ncbi:MAG: hypothetical protein U0Q16_22580 [Bryobacteraceae bacterium]